MKKMIAIIVLSWATFAASAVSTNSISAFESTMSFARLHCAQKAQLSQLDMQLGRDTSPVYYPACLADAIPEVKAAYKKFLATRNPAKVKADARAVLVAWLAAANGAEDDRSPLWNAYNSAVAELDADAAGF